MIGGTSLFGGKGRVLDAIIGGLVIAVIANGLPLITQRSEVQFIITGLVLLLAAVVDALSRRRARIPMTGMVPPAPNPIPTAPRSRRVDCGEPGTSAGITYATVLWYVHVADGDAQSSPVAWA